VAVELAEAYVSLIPTARGITARIGKEMSGPTEKAARQAGDAAGKSFGSRFSSGVKKFAVGAGIGLAVAAAAAIHFGKSFVDAAEESRKIGAQTEQVLRSTGEAANISAKGVANLAGQISAKTGIDDEAIQSGENLLLTFTNIRNEVGRGNDIFSQATSIANDMSVALGQDMKSSAIQLGKALNDPVKGITALQRVGVSFTQQQRDQIATLVKSGHGLEAQKIILGELRKEFGGSAAAQATASDKLKVAFGNVAETLGGLLLPLIDRAATFIQAALPRAIEIGRAALVRIRAAFAAVGAWWERNGPAITAFVQRVFGAIRDWVADVAPAIRSWVHNVLGDLSNWWEDHGPMIIRIAKDVADALAKMIRGGVRAAQFIVDHWSEAWPVIKKVATVITVLAIPAIIRLGVQATISAARQAAAWVISQAGPIATAAVYVVQTAIMVAKWTWLGVQALLSAAKVALAWIISMGPIAIVIAAVVAAAVLIVKNWDTIKKFVTAAARAVVDFLRRNWPVILGILTGPFGLAVVAIIKNWDTIWSFLRSLPGRIVSFFVNAPKWLIEAGKKIVTGLKDGVVWVWTNVLWPWLKGIPGRIVSAIPNPLKLLLGIGKDIIKGMLNGIKAGAEGIGKVLGGIKDKVVGGFKKVFGIGSPSKVMAGVGVNLMQGLLRGMFSQEGPLRKFLSKIGVTVTDIVGPGGGGRGAGQWRNVALAALSYTHQSPAWLGDLLTQMAHESGGNANAINKWDINAQRGDPSRGLMQVIGSTFRHYAGELVGRGIFDPFANIVAAIRYTTARYGTLGAWRARGFKGYGSGAWEVGPGGGYTHEGELVISRRVAQMLRALPGGPGGSAGAGLSIGEVHLHDGVDLDMLERRLEHAITGGRL
jgi:hypothetical protein